MTDPECSDGTPPLKPPVFDLQKKYLQKKRCKKMSVGGPQSPFFDFFIFTAKNIVVCSVKIEN